MASAGRVLLLPKGAWVSGTSYVPLDYVLYNGSSYVCKRATAGSTNPAADTSNWQKLARGITDSEYTDVVSVTADVNSMKTGKVNYSDALTLEEIAASSSLNNKIPKAEAVKAINSKLRSENFSVAARHSDASVRINDSYCDFASGLCHVLTDYSVGQSGISVPLNLADTRFYPTAQRRIMAIGNGQYYAMSVETDGTIRTTSTMAAGEYLLIGTYKI